MDIETFPNPAPGRDYVIQHVADEFTSLCPKTGHPDFGTIVLTYVPGNVCVELKAYKLYLQDFRTKGIFYEAVTNSIFDEMWALMNPRWMRLETIWRGRGGIRSNMIAENADPQYEGPIPPYFS
ncbi:preQ(1) synthase [Cerasicoccus arenae]|uniref:NADPH-dependent 7-cyano-7-deazaguanine reductase n=1 Tax=Cerasicoccus arenae TaxID=424488 RepID=A0A8J3GD47_9BACT|nr:preQ(1) synthase [Cerasicoccus arenae]MBK1858949.1 NADPH-dependent 7-cyano-7-deazaguanine reductase QueF [Cerasicoccus arenae]GHC04033.1 NADPH-dependent 7-cyano-7-deazaguanine reductase [Cerasicoccus arenae]